MAIELKIKKGVNTFCRRPTNLAVFEKIIGQGFLWKSKKQFSLVLLYSPRCAPQPSALFNLKIRDLNAEHARSSCPFLLAAPSFSSLAKACFPPERRTVGSMRGSSLVVWQEKQITGSKDTHTHTQRNPVRTIFSGRKYPNLCLGGEPYGACLHVNQRFFLRGRRWTRNSQGQEFSSRGANGQPYL